MDASNRRHVREAEKAAKVEAINDRAVLAELLQLPHGRSWLWRQLSSAHIFQTSFAPDALTMAFREGERYQGLILLNSILEVDPEGFTLMVNENARRSEAADNARTVADRRAADPADPAGGPAEDAGDDDAVIDYDPSAEPA